MSNSLAHYLRGKGIKRDDVVPILAKRSWHVVVAMLGVLKAGGAYMPVAPDYPEDRIEYMLETAGAKLVLMYGYESTLSREQVDLDDFNYADNKEALDNRNFPEDLCYVIFTSGSTGRPKGVEISHRNLVNFVDSNEKNVYQRHAVEKGSVMLASTVFTFDISVFEIYLSLLNGLEIVMADDDEINSHHLMTNLITKHAIDILQCTPTKLSMLMSNDAFKKAMGKIKVIMLGAEELTAETYHKAAECTVASVFNGYGPTEITIGASFKKIKDESDITIGTPIANTQIYILDQNQSLLPTGVAGELCIAGDGVGRGYLNRPELTAEHFVPNPFATEENRHGKTMYRTGDLARFRVNGEIEYLGRIDTQVKIRGQRIELGEIESVMGCFSGIQMSAITDKRDENNRQYLVGYYTSEASVDETELRKYLSAKLPKYMVPNYFVRLEAMPMTASGKTDRKNLPLPDFTMSSREYIEPRTETEKKLAEIWSELLQTERVGRTEDFFELGGDSLLAITMINRVEEAFHAGISVKEIMEHSILEQLAGVIADAERKSGGIAVRHKKKYILLPQQKAIYAACTKLPDTLEYNMPAWIELPDSIDRGRFKQCIIEVINHHSSLKTYILAENDNIYGVYDDTAEIDFEEYTNEAIADFLRPFDLKKAPLIHIGFTDDKLLFDMHHIIADGESLNIMLKDILCAYAKENLSDLEIQYSDYAEYFMEADFSVHKAFFKNMLKGEFEPMLLPEQNVMEKSEGASKRYFLQNEVVKSAKNYAGRNALTDTMVYLGAFGILLSKYTAKENVLTSIILSNRLHRELANVVGMFVNTLPVSLLVKGNINTFFSLVKKLILDLYEYQELPFLEIAETIGMQDKSVINTSFVYQADGEKVLSLEKQELVANWMNTKTAKFDLSMEITPVKDGCKVRLEYNCAKYDEKLIDDLFKAYERVLMQLTASDVENIEDISVLSKEEKYKLIHEFNDTAVDYPRNTCVHELFTMQAKKTPDKTALVFEDRSFTYRQLDEMSNSLAHYLREKGVKRNDVVPIIAKRSWHVVVAMLGVLKAGGAYMPVAPDYPEDRIEYMLETADAKLVLVYGYGRALPREQINLHDYNYAANKEALDNRNCPEDLCYVIFTSGSTGSPKGVEISHRNLSNFVDGNEKNVYQHHAVKKGCVMLAATVFTFDISVFEIYLSLLNGLEIVMAADDDINSPHLMADLIMKQAIDILQCTPTKLSMLMNNDAFKKAMRKIKVIMLGAEELTPETYHKAIEYTDASVFNGYGPTEITIGASFKQIRNGKDITIGTPIANTQIYILDHNQNLLPIGVAGELCIAGDGVGRGYLNRPELTAERFVPNPFATEENGHGKTMYRTGDLARFRSDGEIEYLGRIDTQVKIRGLRIELGEIESVMSSFPGMQLNAVTDKRDENDRQYLVGYYTAERAIDERELRQHLSAKLPKYMIPNYFVHLNSMPMTSSGKIDRKELPLPDFTVNNSSYTAPETEQEKLCCDILAELLGYEQIGVEDDFFEIGGDSLRAIEYTAKLHDKGVNLALQNVFDYPTVRQLCDFLKSGEVKKVKYQAADFDRYYEMLSKNVIDETFVPEKRGLGNILLTGVTGFLGAHVLDCLMSEESGIIYCLVRGKEKEGCLKRIRGILQYYFGDKYESELGNRIIPIEGDIEREGLAEDIPLDVHTVIHTAATVKHYGSYEYFYRVNVEGTRHVADYARTVGAKMIHISTLSVSGNSMLDELTVYRSEEEKFFYETSFFIGQPLDNVYIHSKFEAEKVIYDAMFDGLDAKVIRVGNLTNRIADFKFQPNYKQNAFLTRVKAILEFGLFPDYLMPLYTEFSPVDLTAEGIVKIAQYADRQNVFHLNSNRPIYYGRLFGILRQLGIPMKVLDGNAFYRALQQTMKDMGTEYIYEALQNDMDKDGRLVYDSNIRIMNDFTVWFLKKVGFEWKEIDMEYIRGYIEYFRKIGFLEV